VALGQHVICIVHGQLVLPFQVNCCVLFVGKPFLTHGASKSILYATLKPHVPVEIVIPIVTFSTLLALECLFVRIWFSLSRA